jgi:hypothetical protein
MSMVAFGARRLCFLLLLALLMALGGRQEASAARSGGSDEANKELKGSKQQVAS